MLVSGPGLLLAVHISDNVLHLPWLLAGFAVAAALALVGSWRIRDEEIPQIALLTAVFFVASSIHVPVGPGSVHLLLNGLVGILLGRRACLAIPVALLLQCLLLQHGGLFALGVNSCVMTLPALAAWALFAGLRRWPGWRQPWCRTLLVTVSSLVWTLSCVYSVTLLLTALDLSLADDVLFHPTTLTGALVLSWGAVWLERRLENRPEFPLGLLLGELTVLATVGLNFLVLVWGGETNFFVPALIVALTHLPLAVVEGVVVGCTVGFLARVKPAMLGLPQPAISSSSEAVPHATSPPPALPCPAGPLVVADADRRGPGPSP